MRGSQRHLPCLLMYMGIIPAHAGLTGRRSGISCEDGDHPRACGAHALFTARENTLAGSSPRMRGSHCLLLFRRNNLGIIPAHAGLTKIDGKWEDYEWDHPRACGAHKRSQSPCRPSPGSSPRMRGSHRLVIFFEPFRGIIPAHAGLTVEDAFFPTIDWDHPRACGAHFQNIW